MLAFLLIVLVLYHNQMFNNQKKIDKIQKQNANQIKKLNN